MTESEAKRKWCPMLRFHVVSDHPFSNKLGDGKIDETTDKCIGSACMMWRQESITDIDAKKQGFCGLAGKQ